MAEYVQQPKEWFSRAFLQAVSATAGYTVDFTLNDVWGVDATVEDDGITTDWQMKATAKPEFVDGNLAFDLDVSTYNKLAVQERTAEAYLGVVVLPGEDRRDWLTCSDTSMVLSKRGYWLKLAGLPKSANVATQRVHLPSGNLMNVENLEKIMKAARRRLRA